MEGIFRIPGVQAKIDLLKEQFDSGVDDIETIAEMFVIFL